MRIYVYLLVGGSGLTMSMLMLLNLISGVVKVSNGVTVCLYFAFLIFQTGLSKGS